MRSFRAYQSANQLREPAANLRPAVRRKGGSGSLLNTPNQGDLQRGRIARISNMNFDGAKIWLPPSFGPRACSDFRPAPSRGVGSSRGAPPLRVIRAVTIRYIWRWLAGWLLFRCLAPGFAGRALVLGNRPTGAGRFRFTGARCGRAGGAFSGRRNRKRGQAGKFGMKRKGGARITRYGAGVGKNLMGVG